MPTTAIASTTAAIMLSASVYPRCRGAGGSIIFVRVATGIAPRGVSDDLAGERFVDPSIVRAGRIGHVFSVADDPDAAELRQRVLGHLAEIRSEFVDGR